LGVVDSDHQKHFILFEDWATNPKLVLERTCQFLKMDHTVSHRKPSEPHYAKKSAFISKLKKELWDGEVDASILKNYEKLVRAAKLQNKRANTYTVA